MGAPHGNRNAAGYRGGKKRKTTMSSTRRLKWMISKHRTHAKSPRAKMTRAETIMRKTFLKKQAAIRKKSIAEFKRIHKR